MSKKTTSSLPARQDDGVGTRNRRIENSRRAPPHQMDQRYRELREYALDRTLAETFPCSDPLSSIPNPQAH